MGLGRQFSAVMLASVLSAPAGFATQNPAAAPEQMAAPAPAQTQQEYEQQLLAYQQALVSDQAKIKIDALHRAIKQQDRETVATSVCYPVRIMFRDKQMNVENKETFLQYYEAVFTGRFMDTLEKINWTPKAIGAKGIAVGDGQVWFDMNGCVVTFNNNWYVM